MSYLPILISIPHGGDLVPSEVIDKVCLSSKDLFEDSDSFTREIYGIKENVMALVETKIARAIIDLNRDVLDRPPKNPDGIIKTRTCHGKAIYRYDDFPGEPLIKKLIQGYYHVYHQKIVDLLAKQPGLQLALDCHSMEAIGPEISPDRGQERPMICLGNNHGESCPNEWAEKLAECFRESFQLGENEVTINQPFAGGFITKKYGNAPLPWIQIEMNRSLYLKQPWFNRETLSVDTARLEELRTSFLGALRKFFG